MQRPTIEVSWDNHTKFHTMASTRPLGNQTDNKFKAMYFLFEKNMEVEAIARVNGAVPASIDIMYGVPHIGLTSEQLKILAISGSQFQKTTPRDIPHIVSDYVRLKMVSDRVSFPYLIYAHWV
ncbi:uncharacterized protein LOC124687060 [Lolium rigidum]|uniref:uncharacterized protein LOC124687060 n=1 Tax=Lolium rigidum TaxID=89674 RepID=UPI001F5E3100|nr:uncharacterized protein LOC124687060 [Lolium rigidum]XP_047076868.1 uncharacterized protein LOC124687060 [Lolium rigidum]